MSLTALRETSAPRGIASLMPIMAVVFVAFLVIGVEAVRSAPMQSRGLAMGAYTAFLDLAQGLASPALGLIAVGARLNVVFLASAVIVLGAALVALWLMAHPITPEGPPS
ncbi:putative MFS family arabinose efflux permease [Bradyrhizobium sp. USDA 4354]